MKNLSIERVLRQGIIALKEGNRHNAECLYKAILLFEPQPPETNHNLDAIENPLKKAEMASSSFKINLEANSKPEQLWLNYINALIKEKQFNNAKRVIEQAKKQGVCEKKLIGLKAQLSPLSEEETTSGLIPSQQEISILLEYYKSGQLENAEKLATSITGKYPTHPFSWKVLGALLNQTGRVMESLHVMQKSVQLMPKDAEALNNLGNTLNKLSRLEEAEVNYRKSIELKPDYAEAYFNLGSTLSELDRLEEAEASYRQSIELKPDYAEAYSNLGVINRKKGKLKEAEANYRKSIELKPDYANAYYNLGNTLKEQGRLNDAKASYMQAITLKPKFDEAKHMHSALSGETTVIAPRNYVEGLFDKYADKFEISLVNKLQYKTPKIMTEIIMKNSKTDFLGSILDLGCGTGLFGNEIRKFCEQLEGVDLSEKMLNKAKEKNIYNKLIKQDILDYLSNEELNFDYFVSTDVFVYIGDLFDIFRLIKHRNKTGGKLVFSTEHHEGERFSLEKSGRYSHSKKYIQCLCETFGYKIHHFETLALRKEKKRDISGGFYLLDF